MSSNDSTRSVQLKRVFDAPPELVWRAWTDPKHVANWMKCNAQATLELHEWEPAVGARFRTRMFQPGVFEAETVGVFLEVDPPHVLAYRSDADPKLGVGELTVRIELRAVGEGTELTLTHTGIPGEMIRGVIEAGWSTSLGFLQDVVVALVGAWAGARMGVREARRAQRDAQ